MAGFLDLTGLSRFKSKLLEAIANGYVTKTAHSNALDLKVNKADLESEINRVLGTLDTGIQVGTILPFDGTNVPSGYLVCNGAAVSRTTYAALFAVLGTRHGDGDGKTTFNLPTTNRRFLEMTTSTGEVGSTVEAGLPNISGSFVAVFSGNEVSGAFSSRSTGRSKNGTDWDGQKINFSASSSSGIYGKSSSVQPTSIRCLAIIKS